MRINLRSIAFSWMFALGLLGLLLLLGAPNVARTGTPDVIELPGQLAPAGKDQLTSLQSTIWCALESGQTVRLSVEGRQMQFHGAMAIAPEWRGKALPAPQQKRVDHCVQQRLQQLAGTGREGHRAALTFLFTNI
ncbi:MAG: hypothetical protein ACOY7J_15525 [Pseudomonadota bacterium]